MAPNPAEQLAQFERALQRDTHNATLMVRMALCLRALRRLPEALAFAARARSAAADDPDALEALGAFYSVAGEQQHALEAFNRLLVIRPRHAPALFNRAAVRRFLGDLSGAESDYDRALEVQPEDYEAYLNRSELRVQTSVRNHTAELEALLTGKRPDWRGEMQLRYALAKEYEDLAQYRKSWQHLTAGAGLRRSHLQYDVSNDLSTVEWLCAAFPAPPERVGGHDSAAPIFIVGLPRSGSTLVERILGSHSMVTAAGELEHFALAVIAAAHGDRPGLQLPRRELIERSAKLDFRALGADYIARTGPVAVQSARFTDKMPLNYLYCGLIKRALPNARVIHVTRHPLAVCHAMFKTLFKQGYPFSYDLSEISRYYIGYRRLMEHWHSTLPGFIYELNYERLIADQQAETRRLLEFCGLGWEQACLFFERNPSPTTTASASQVRRSLYDSSAALWRHYAIELDGLRGQLQAAGIDAG